MKKPIYTMSNKMKVGGGGDATAIKGRQRMTVGGKCEDAWLGLASQPVTSGIGRGRDGITLVQPDIIGATEPVESMITLLGWKWRLLSWHGTLLALSAGLATFLNNRQSRWRNWRGRGSERLLLPPALPRHACTIWIGRWKACLSLSPPKTARSLTTIPLRHRRRRRRHMSISLGSAITPLLPLDGQKITVVFSAANESFKSMSEKELVLVAARIFKGLTAYPKYGTTGNDAAEHEHALRGFGCPSVSRRRRKCRRCLKHHTTTAGGNI